MRESIKLKLYILLALLFFMPSCAQLTAFLGPAISIGTTGETYRAAISYSSDYIIKKETGKTALEHIKQSGVTRKQVGLIIDGEPLLMPNTKFWPVSIDGKKIGKVTSAVYSPRLEKNLALAMVETRYDGIGRAFKVEIQGQLRDAQTTKKPFYDPDKKLTKS